MPKIKFTTRTIQSLKPDAKKVIEYREACSMRTLVTNGLYHRQLKF